MRLDEGGRRLGAEILEGYKETPVGVIPEEWEITTLGDRRYIDKIKAGGTPKATNREYYNGNIPFVKIEDITRCSKYLTTTSTYITKDGLENSSAWMVPPYSILYSMYASYGEVAINKMAVATNQAIINIIPQKIILVEFLYYSLVKMKSLLNRFIRETTQKNLNAQIVKSLQVPLPPLPEQRKIAAILSTTDAAIQETDAIIAQTELVKRGLMQRLLTKGIGHTVFKDTKIGAIPEGWERVDLRNKKYFKLLTGGTPSTKIPDYWNGDVPWMLSGEIHKKRVYNTEKSISKLGYENSNATLLPKKSVLIALAGQGKTRGNVAITEIELTTNQSIAAIISNQKFVSSYYIYYKLESMYDKLRTNSAGSGRAGLSLTIIRDIKLALPPLPEQRKIAAILSTVDEKLEVERQHRTRLDTLKKGLMQVLLTGKVRVEVDAHA